MVQTDSMRPKVVIVCGPTASGKSKLAIDLALFLKSEIISADSIAIYKGLDIGTAKPDERERALVKHNMIDVVEPTEEFSVAEYERAALAEINRLVSENKVPIVCGGTGYYIDSLIYRNSYGNCPKDPEIRRRLSALKEEKGSEYLYALLKEVDEATACGLSPNDYLRVSRALEIFYSTGKRKSEIVDDRTPRLDYIALSVDLERQSLYERIENRVDKMFEDGLIGEVKGLIDSGVPAYAQSMQGIGYKEIVEGLGSGASVEEMKELVKRNTRRYAKRQITYFKRTKDLRLLPSESSYEAAEKILKDELFVH